MAAWWPDEHRSITHPARPHRHRCVHSRCRLLTFVRRLDGPGPAPRRGAPRPGPHGCRALGAAKVPPARYVSQRARPDWRPSRSVHPATAGPESTIGEVSVRRSGARPGRVPRRSRRPRGRRARRRRRRRSRCVVDPPLQVTRTDVDHEIADGPASSSSADRPCRSIDGAVEEARRDVETGSAGTWVAVTDGAKAGGPATGECAAVVLVAVGLARRGRDDRPRRWGRPRRLEAGSRDAAGGSLAGWPDLGPERAAGHGDVGDDRDDVDLQPHRARAAARLAAVLAPAAAPARAGPRDQAGARPKSCRSRSPRGAPSRRLGAASSSRAWSTTCWPRPSATVW